jgi:hypothetical protein
LESDGCADVGWIELPQDKIHYFFQHDDESSVFIKLEEFLDQLSDYQWTLLHEADLGGMHQTCNPHREYKILLWIYEGKRRLGSPRRRWNDIIKIGLLEVGCKVVGWVQVSENEGQWRAFVNAVMDIRVL